MDDQEAASAEEVQWAVDNAWTVIQTATHLSAHERMEMHEQIEHARKRLEAGDVERAAREIEIFMRAYDAHPRRPQ